MANLAGNVIKKGFIEALKGGSKHFVTLCESILNNTDLIHDLKRFELLVADALFCGPILSDLLEIPRVELCAFPPRVGMAALLRNIPVPPSYVPVFLSRNTDHMTLLQRVKNVLVYGLQRVLLDLFFMRPFNNLKTKYHIKPERSIWKAAADYEMLLISTDFAVEYPHPLMPCKYI